MAYGGPYIPNMKAMDESNAQILQPTHVAVADPNLGKPTSSWLRLAKDGASKVASLIKGTSISAAKAAVGTGMDVANTIGNAEVKGAKAIGIKAKTGTLTNKQQFGTKLAKFGGSDNPKQFAGNVAQTAALVVPGGKAAEAGVELSGKFLLDQIGRQGVKELAEKIGIDTTRTDAEDLADQVAKDKVGQQAAKAIAKGGPATVSTVLKSAGKNAAIGATFGAGSAASQNASGKQILKSGAEGAAIGAGAGVAGEFVKDVKANNASKSLNKVGVSTEDLKATAVKHQAAEKMANEKGLPVGKIVSTPKQIGAGEVKQASQPKELSTAQAAKPMSVKGLKPIGSTTGTKAVSQLSAKVNAKAVENKLTEDLGDAKEHGVMDIKQQAQKASDLINNDEQKATDIALGKRNAPSGLHPHAVFVAVEKKATADGNVELLRQLSQSTRVDEATAAGQTLRVLRERDQESPVAAMQQVAKARSDAVEKRIGSVPKAVNQTAKDIGSYIKPPSKLSWQAFVEGIKC
jgi:hypothetical protein